MVGFGAGAYVIALWDRGAAPLGGDGARPGDDAGGPVDNPAPGGCCDAGAAPPIGPGLLLLLPLCYPSRRARRAIMWRGRRRRA